MKFLIVKTSALGDIIHAMPVIDFLKNHYPSSRIDWVAESSCADLLHHHPDINEVIEVDTKQWRGSLFSRKSWSKIFEFRRRIKACRYDIAFDLQGNIKSGLILSAVSSARKVGFGKQSVAEWPNLLFTGEKYELPFQANIRDDCLSILQKSLQIDAEHIFRQVTFTTSPEEIGSIEAFLDETAPTILISPGSHWENKRASAYSLHELVRLIHLEYPKVRYLYSWGTEKEMSVCKQLCEKVADQSIVLPKMRLSSLQSLMKNVDLVIAMDSLPLHLAATTTTPTIGVFGPSSAKKYAPVGNNHLTIQGQCPYRQSFEKRCPLLRSCPTGGCIKNITGGELFELVNRSLRKSARS